MSEQILENAGYENGGLYSGVTALEAGNDIDSDEGVETIKLRKPIVFEGETFREIILDFDKLTANDLIKAEREAKLRMGKKQRIEIPKEMDSKFTACVAAIAAGVKTELIYLLGAQDFTTATMAVSNFLLGGGSSDTED